MTLSRVTVGVVDLMRQITDRGPDGPEYDGLRVFQHPGRMQHQLMGRKANIAPVTIDLWPSLSCNARCPLCQYRISGARDDVDGTNTLRRLDPRLAQEILAGAAALGLQSVILTGGGEPLLNPYIVRIARSARDQGLRWGLITNGRLLTPILARDLLREQPAFLRVSLDAGTPEARGVTYGLKPDDFEQVVEHVVAAARVSRELCMPVFGVSFALAAGTCPDELVAIRCTIERILSESDGALGFVVFRPRLRHYSGLQPVCPQPEGKEFLVLADAIVELVIEPIKKKRRGPVRLDIKKGLFRLAAREQMPKGCLSAPWMTTITQDGRAYMVAELAGADDLHHCWARIAKAGDFRVAWHGDLRRSLQEAALSGEIPVPIVHRTSPIDEFLRCLSTVTGDRMDDRLASEILEAVGGSTWYRSASADFV